MAVARKARAGREARPHREVEGTPRTGAKRTVMGYIAELPAFLRLLWGLVTDARNLRMAFARVAGNRRARISNGQGNKRARMD